MKSLILTLLFLTGIPASAFEWPGGTMTIAVSCRGEEVFAGMVPHGPWGSTVWQHDPVLELFTEAGQFVDQRTITGSSSHWYGGSRSGTVSFTAPTGNYSLRGVEGTRHVRISGEGYSGFRMHFVSIVEPAPPQPPPVDYLLGTSTGQGGGISPGGQYSQGATALVVASPSANYEFAGWSGDAAGLANPLTVLMDANKNVHANFTIKQFALTTAASGHGSVTAGGTYPYGSIVTVSAAPGTDARFAGWSGDASGTAPSIALTMTQPRAVHALFISKTAQVITFDDPGTRPAGSPPFPLSASSSSGLPVSFAVVSGPAVIEGNQLQLLWPGAVVVQATQAGDAEYLPATAVTRTFQAIGDAVVKLGATTSTLLQQRDGQAPANVVIRTP